MITLFGEECMTISDLKEELNLKTVKSVYFWLRKMGIPLTPYRKSNVAPISEIKKRIKGLK